MKITYKPSLMKVKRTKTRFIIIHHTYELYRNPAAKVDGPGYQYPYLTAGSLELKDPDVNYNFVVENIKDDTQIIMARPFVYKCDFDDIPNNINDACIHIALLGNYNLKIPSKRMYETIGYKLLAPLLKTFSLAPSRIKLHSEVSEDKDCNCPGDFVDKSVIESMARRFLKR